jgi:hypothetical protein
MRIATYQWKWAVLASLLIASQSLQAQTVIVGPGVVPAPFGANGAEYRILAGTEIVSQTSNLSSDGRVLRGQNAGSLLFQASVEVEGGLFEGASVTTQAGVVYAQGGHAFMFDYGFNNADFHDGTYHGGSVIIDAPPPADADFRAGSALFGWAADSISVVNIYGGHFEGGIVSLAATPDIPIVRAPALSLGSEYGVSVDVYGGEFVGGIEVPYYFRESSTALRIHGSDFSVSPEPVDGRFTGPADVVVSGKYGDGSLFSHNLRLERRPEGISVYQEDGFIFFGSVFVPEPNTSILAVSIILPVLAGLPSRRLRRPQVREREHPRGSQRASGRS